MIFVNQKSATIDKNNANNVWFYDRKKMSTPKYWHAKVGEVERNVSDLFAFFTSHQL